MLKKISDIEKITVDAKVANKKSIEKEYEICKKVLHDAINAVIEAAARKGNSSATFKLNNNLYKYRELIEEDLIASGYTIHDFCFYVPFKSSYYPLYIYWNKE